MNIDSLKLFYYVAQSNSISVVAKQNHISQSALSQQLLKLEQKFDTKLFNRSNKGVTLTKEGEVVLKHCKNILTSLDDLFKELESLKNHRELLTIKAPEILNSTLISASLMDIRKRYSKLNINLYNFQSLDDTLLSLLNDEISFSFHDKGILDGIIQEKIFEDEFILITNSNYQGNSFSSKDLLNVPLIAVEDFLNAHNCLYTEIKRKVETSKTLNIILSTQSYGPATYALITSNAFLLVPKSTYLACYKNLGFIEIKMEDISLPLNLYMNYSESSFKNEKRFILALKNSVLNKLHN
ncbi:MAG: LysR family transcriptional regulator [Clostridium sp.]